MRAALLLAAALPAHANDLGAHIADAGLPIRSGCHWSRPGGDPWHGDNRRALIAMGVPADVARRIAARIGDGDSDGVVDFRRDGVASRDGIGYAPHFATTFGQAVCMDTRVAFDARRTEPADRYTDGAYTVVVARVCGNLALLSPAGTPHTTTLPPAAAPAVLWGYGSTAPPVYGPPAYGFAPVPWGSGWGVPGSPGMPHGAPPALLPPVAGPTIPATRAPVSAPGTALLIAAGIAAAITRRHG